MRITFITLKALFLLTNILIFSLLLLPALAANITIWWLDNLLNLQLQLSTVAIALLLVNYAYIKQYKVLWTLLFSVTISINMLPLYLSPESPTLVKSNTQTFTVAQLNLNYNNPNLQKIMPMLGTQQFDLLVLQEVSDKEHKTVQQLNKYYPFSFGLSPLEATPSGLAIFSSIPISEKQIHNLGFKSGQILEIILQMPNTNTPIQVYSMHPSSPRDKTLWQTRNQTLDNIAKQASMSAFSHKLIIGDFNTSPWSSKFNHLQTTSQLKNSAQGFGYLPSWSLSNAPLLSIFSSVYIDHLLISDAFQVVDKYAQVIVGSDHQLIISKLSL